MHVGARHFSCRLGCEGCNDEIAHYLTYRGAWWAVCQATLSFAHASVVHRLGPALEKKQRAKTLRMWRTVCRKLLHCWRASTTCLTFFATLRVLTCSRLARQSLVRG